MSPPFSPFDLVVRRIFDRVETTRMDFIPIPRDEAQTLLQGIRDLKTRAQAWRPSPGDKVRFIYATWGSTPQTEGHAELIVTFHSLEPAR